MKEVVSMFRLHSTFEFLLVESICLRDISVAKFLCLFSYISHFLLINNIYYNMLFG